MRPDGIHATVRFLERGHPVVDELFSCEQHREGDATLVAFRGELDMTNATEAFDVLIEAIRKGDVIIEASELTFIDSSGIRSLVEAHREAHRGIGAGRTVVVRNPSEPVRRVLEVTGFDTIIEGATEGS